MPCHPAMSCHPTLPSFFNRPSCNRKKRKKIYLIKNVLHLYFLAMHTVSRAPSGCVGHQSRCDGDTDFGTASADRRRPEAPISPGSILAGRREAKPAFSERIHECCFQILICKIANFELQRREPLPSLLTGLNGRYCAVRLAKIPRLRRYLRPPQRL